MQLRRLQRVLQQAGDSHRPDAAGHRRDPAGVLAGGCKIHVAAELAAAPPAAFDREAVGACIGADPEGMSVGLIEGSRHAQMVSDACAVLPLLFDDLPPKQASEVMLIVITLLAAEDERRQAEAAATE